jgi:hypothetical protein
VSFDSNLRAQQYNDKNGNATVYSYNGFGRLSSVYSYTPSFCAYNIPYESRTTTYSYDPLGRVTQMTETDVDCPAAVPVTHTQTFSYSYDGADNVLTETQSTTGGTVAQPPTTAAYQYDLNGRRTGAQMTVSGASLAAVSYAYDCADELVDMANGGPLKSASCSATNFVSGCHTGDGSQVSFCYDNDGRRVGQQSSSVYTVNAYDGASRLTGISYSNLATGAQYGNLAYSYDKD